MSPNLSMSPNLLVMLLLLSCQPRQSLLENLDPLPPTPPLSSPQKWAVIKVAALHLFAAPDTLAQIENIIPRGQLLQLLSLRRLASGDWSQVRYQEEAGKFTQGWLPAGGLAFFSNQLEAEITAQRLTSKPAPQLPTQDP